MILSGTRRCAVHITIAWTFRRWAVWIAVSIEHESMDSPAVCDALGQGRIYPANIWNSFQIAKRGKAINAASTTNRMPTNVAKLDGIRFDIGILCVFVVIVASIGTIAMYRLLLKADVTAITEHRPVRAFVDPDPLPTCAVLDCCFATDH
jgi:hypothetical protein